MSNKRFFLFLFLLMGVSFFAVNFMRPSSFAARIIDGDGSGFYAYLPAVFVYGTVDFTPVFEFEKSQRSSDYQGHYFHPENDILINKYTAGTALMELPFFLIAYFLSLLLGLEADGFNLLFQYSVALAAFCWVFVGFIFLQKLADLYEIKKRNSQLLILAFFFGTNLFYYTLIAPAASHAYSFAMISILLYFIKSTFISYVRWKVFLAAFILGLVVLVRPVNLLVVVAIPFLASSPQIFMGTIKQKLRNKDFVFTILLFILALLPQFIINTMQTGWPFVLGYKNEGFYFFDPEMVNFLFSFRKGWFVYTPFMLFLIPAVFYLLKRSFFEFIGFLSFFLVLVYIFSSWWNWFFGDSFGMRPMVDFIGLFFVVIALFYNSFRKNTTKYIFWIFTTLFIMLNLFQTYQTTAGILHVDSMNFKAYKYIFLKTGSEYKNTIADDSEYYYGFLDDEPFFETAGNLENHVKGWSEANKVYYVPNKDFPCVEMNASSVYSPTYTYTIPENLKGSANIYVKFNASYFEPEINAGLNALFMVDISDTAGKSVFYKGFRMKKLPDDISNEWRKGEIGFKLPLLRADMSMIKFYIWNKEKETYYIKSLELRFFRYSR